MARNDVTVRVRDDTDLSSARSEASRTFSAIESDAEQAADGIGDKLSDIGSSIDLSSAGAALSSQIGQLAAVGGPVGAAVSVVSSALGDDLAEGFARGFSAKRSAIELSIQTGLSEIDLAPVGRAAGDAYSAGFGESLGEVRNTASLLQTELAGLDASIDLTQSTKQAQLLSDVLGVEMERSITTTRRLIANDLVRDTDEAFGLIGGSAQRFRLDSDDILDSISEFSPVLKKIGFDGKQAFSLVGEGVQQGLFQNTDRVLETLEEFNIRLSETDTLRAPIDRLGLSFEDMQNKLATGRGVEAITQISSALLAMEDPVERNALALEIFGPAMESVADPEIAIQLFAQADGAGAASANMEELAAQAEAAQSGFDSLQKTVESGASIWGRGADAVLRFGFSQHEAFVETLKTTVGLNDQEEAVVSLGAGILNYSVRAADAMDSTSDLAGEVDGLDSSAEAAAESVTDIKAALDELFNFSADQLMRNIADATDRLSTSLEEADGSAIGLNGSIDIMAEGGAELQASFERLSGQQATNIRQFNEGKLSADEFATANATVEANLRAVLAGSRLTADQVQGLIDKYLATPAEVRTVVTADTAGAELGVNTVRRLLSLLPSRVSIPINTYTPTARITTPSGIRRRASGGLTQGLTLVGEDGPELADFETPTRIYSNRNSQDLFNSGGRSGPAVYVENWNVSDGRDSAQDLRMVESLYRAVAS